MGWDPGTVSLAVNGSNNVTIHFSSNANYVRFAVRYVGDNLGINYRNWTVTEAATPTTKLVAATKRRIWDSSSLSNLSQLANGPGFITAYFTNPIDFRGGRHYFHSGGSGAAVINTSTYAMQIGPGPVRTTGADTYYGGIAFNHLLNQTGTLNQDNTGNNIAPQAWVGLRLHDATGSERSFLVFATKPGIGTTGAGTDIPVERMTIDPVDGYVGINVPDPTARLHVNGDSRLQGNSRLYIGPNSTWSADLVLGGNGRTEPTKATVAATDGNLHIDAANGKDLYLNFYNGRDTLTHSGYTFWHSGNLTNLSQLTNGPGFITSAGSVQSLNGILWNRFVYGDNETKTTTLTNWNQALASGFFNGNNATGAPTASTWWHGLVIRHNNTANNYQLQLLHAFSSDADIRVRTVNNGSYGAWRSVWTNGGTNALTNLSQLTNGPEYLGKNGNTRYQANEAIEFLGTYGLYSATNAARLYANDGSYGAWKIEGTRGSWGGLEFVTATGGNISLMIQTAGTQAGFANNTGGWMFRRDADNLYVWSGASGGGTQRTVWHNGNLTNLSQLTNGPGYVTGGTQSSSTEELS